MTKIIRRSMGNFPSQWVGDVIDSLRRSINVAVREAVSD
jgi:hypothetical protein